MWNFRKFFASFIQLTRGEEENICFVMLADLETLLFIIIPFLFTFFFSESRALSKMRSLEKKKRRPFTSCRWIFIHPKFPVDCLSLRGFIFMMSHWFYGNCYLVLTVVVFLFGLLQSQNGFEELRLHVKEGGDLCKELSSILQERLVPKLRHAVRVAVPCGHASLLFCATTGKEKQNEDARILLGRANRGLVSLSICWSVK